MPLLLLAGAATASAHSSSVSYMVLDVLGAQVRLYLELDGLDVRETLPLDINSDERLDADETASGRASLEALLGRTTTLSVAGTQCQPGPVRVDHQPRPETLHLRAEYECAQPAQQLDLSVTLPAAVRRSSHRVHARVRGPSGTVKHLVFTPWRARQTVSIDQPAEQRSSAGAFRAALFRGGAGLARAAWLLPAVLLLLSVSVASQRGVGPARTPPGRSPTGRSRALSLASYGLSLPMGVAVSHLGAALPHPTAAALTAPAIVLALTLHDLLRGPVASPAERTTVWTLAAASVGLALGLATPPLLVRSALPSAFFCSALAGISLACLGAAALVWAAGLVLLRYVPRSARGQRLAQGLALVSPLVSALLALS